MSNLEIYVGELESVTNILDHLTHDLLTKAGGAHLTEDEAGMIRYQSLEVIDRVTKLKHWFYDETD